MKLSEQIPLSSCHSVGPEALNGRALQSLETRYRRLFEAARDGILLVDPATRKITDSNPFMSELLDRMRKALNAALPFKGEAQVNSSLDGIFVMGAGGRKILQNRRIAELCQIPAEIAEDPDERRRFDWATSRLWIPCSLPKNSNGFRRALTRQAVTISSWWTAQSLTATPHRSATQRVFTMAGFGPFAMSQRHACARKSWRPHSDAKRD